MNKATAAVRRCRKATDLSERDSRAAYFLLPSAGVQGYAYPKEVPFLYIGDCPSRRLFFSKETLFICSGITEYRTLRPFVSKGSDKLFYFSMIQQLV